MEMVASDGIEQQQQKQSYPTSDYDAIYQIQKNVRIIYTIE